MSARAHELPQVRALPYYLFPTVVTVPSAPQGIRTDIASLGVFPVASRNDHGPGSIGPLARTDQ